MRPLPFSLRTYDGTIRRLLGYDATEDRFMTIDDYGAVYFYTPTERIAKLDNLPNRIVLNMPCVLGILDKLVNDPTMPMLDVDSILSTCLHVVESSRTLNDNSRERAVTSAIEEIVDQRAMNFIENPLSRHHLEYGLRAVLNAAQTIFNYHNLYTGGTLLYDYEQRRGSQAVVLKRKRYVAFG